MLQNISMMAALSEHHRLTQSPIKTSGEVRVRAIKNEEKRLKGR